VIYTPRPFQGIITDHELDNPRCVVFADMGVGKTVSTLTALDQVLLIHGGPILVLAPLRVALSTWPDECRKWDHLKHLRVCPIVGTLAQRLDAVRTPADIYTLNYDNMVWLTEYFGTGWPFETVVADELTRLKSFRIRQGGKRSQALGRVAHTRVKRFIGLTGTPAPNGLQDLWGQFWFIDAGVRLGRTYSAFKERWFQQSYDGYGSVPKSYAAEQIQDAIKDLCVTIRAADWFDVKKPIVNDIYIDLPVKVRAMYRSMEKALFCDLSKSTVEAFNAASMSQKLLQLASGAVYLNPQKDWEEVHAAKIEALRSIVEEANGAPVLVAYHFKSDLTRLLKAFPQGRVLDAKPGTQAEWNAGAIPILFAHPASAGHGLNLQVGGNILVYFSHDWNLENRLQILERIGPVRQMQSGLDRPVFVHNIIARNTIDEDVIDRMDEKKSVQDVLLNAMRRRA